MAEHSWRIALMAFWLRDEFPQADMDRVIRMCLIHDLGECFTGDIPTFRKTAEDEVREERLLHEWVDTLPPLMGRRCAPCTGRWPPRRLRSPASIRPWTNLRP